ncbi:tyrosine-type recombinase/integrase [Cryobacterium sp. MLB-32]|uniref:tyrosine-type recombinase/integrase n=1 Tax=Cryobacterium sp. MLB-32 TaxID=1529318 RepID=UPI0018CF86DE|nr:tyrosine-type recombinase/integrase [Cryobacterium sp. MLB-32]
MDVATLPDGANRYVILDRNDDLHIASSWLTSLADLGRSPNTIKSYGRRVAAYLSWTSPVVDWRAASLAHMVLWRRALSADGALKPRSVDISFVALRAFYEWADSRDLITSRVVPQMSEVKYYAAGTAGGGEHGSRRRVTSPRLISRHDSTDDLGKEWISEAGPRERLEELTLRKRDRFLIDLMYFTGVRSGEALSLFTRDMHLGGGSKSSGCALRDPHFHVRMNNPVTNGARAKGQARTLYTRQHLVDSYIDYVIERDAILGSRDSSPHMLVNLYTSSDSQGDAMKYSRVLSLVKRCGREIGFPLTGPHMLRHTFATRLARGIDCEPQPAPVIQALLGHRSADSTKVYTHDMEAAKLQALMTLPSRRFDMKAD